MRYGYEDQCAVSGQNGVSQVPSGPVEGRRGDDQVSGCGSAHPASHSGQHFI